MHTIFDLASPWTSAPVGGVLVWRRPDSRIRVEVDPLGPLPVDRKTWGEQVLFRNLPEGGSVRQTEILNAVNHKGWPATVVSTAALDADENAVESQITVFYEFLYFGTSIAVIIPADEVERWEDELRESVVDQMLSAEPSFETDDVANVAELWDLSRPDSN